MTEQEYMDATNLTRLRLALHAVASCSFEEPTLEKRRGVAAKELREMIIRLEDSVVRATTAPTPAPPR